MMNTDDLISYYVRDYLESESGKYVVFDGSGKVLYENDLAHCVAWIYEMRDARMMSGGEDYKVWSREAYAKFIGNSEDDSSDDGSCPMYY